MYLGFLFSVLKILLFLNTLVHISHVLQIFNAMLKHREILQKRRLLLQLLLILTIHYEIMYG